MRHVLFDTDLAGRLRSAGVDTMAITGCTTSRCVRAAAHEQSFIDPQAKYADAESVGEVLAHLVPASEDDGEDEDGQREQRKIDYGKDSFAPVIECIGLRSTSFAVEFADE